MSKYENIIFQQGQEAEETLELIKNCSEEVAVNYLKEWDMGENYDVSDTEPFGKADTTVEIDGYILSYNTYVGYVGLCKKVE